MEMLLDVHMATDHDSRFEDLVVGTDKLNKAHHDPSKFLCKGELSLVKRDNVN